MAIPSVKIAMIKKNVTDKEGRMYIRVHVPGTKKYVPKSLKEVLPESAWDDKAQIVRKGYPNHSHLTQNFHRKRNEVRGKLLEADGEGIEINERFIRALLGGNKKANFHTLVKEWKEAAEKPVKKDGKLQTALSEATIKSRGSLLAHVEAYAGQNIPMTQINTAWLKGLEDHMCKTGEYGTTVAVRMAKIKGILRRAGEDGLIDPRVIRSYKAPKWDPPPPEWLTIGQTEKVEECLYRGDYDERLTLKTTAAFFLIECYCGLRFSDWGRFKVETLINDRAVRARTKKTGGAVYVPLKKSPRLARLVDYIEENGLRATMAHKTANELVKEVVSKAGIEVYVTTHTGRHTCATLLSEMGYSDAAIAEQLGISERTARTVYIHNTPSKLKKDYEERGGL